MDAVPPGAGQHHQEPAGHTGHPSELPRGTFGPKGITALARRHGLARVGAASGGVLPAASARHAERLYDPSLTLESVITERSLTLHLWNEKLTALKRTPPPRGWPLLEGALEPSA